MTLRDYCDLDVDTSELFGVTRLTCHFHLLKAAFKADVDVLLPTLYYACADFSVKNILSDPTFFDMECLNTLLVGQAALGFSINDFVARLPNEVPKASGVSVCTSKETCIRMAYFESTTSTTSLTRRTFRTSMGDVMVNDCFGLCTRCKAEVSKLIDGERERIWVEVPSYFNSQAWNIIQANLDEIYVQGNGNRKKGEYIFRLQVVTRHLTSSCLGPTQNFRQYLWKFKMSYCVMSLVDICPVSTHRFFLEFFFE